jgi:hypothetical protein
MRNGAAVARPTTPQPKNCNLLLTGLYRKKGLSTAFSWRPPWELVVTTADLVPVALKLLTTYSLAFGVVVPMPTFPPLGASNMFPGLDADDRTVIDLIETGSGPTLR